MFRQHLNRLQPPLTAINQLLQLLRKPIPDNARRIAAHDGKIRHIPRHHGTRTNHRSVANPSASGKNDRSCSNPHIMANESSPLMIALGSSQPVFSLPSGNEPPSQLQVSKKLCGLPSRFRKTGDRN